MPENLRCKECLSKELGFGQLTCKRHGADFIDYKCRFCCKIALYVCFNGTHLCESCHLKACRTTLNFHRDAKYIKCSSSTGKCPLGIEDHALAWKNPRFALGCSLCRSEKMHLWVDGRSVVHQRSGSCQNRTKHVKGEFCPRKLRTNKKEQLEN